MNETAEFTPSYEAWRHGGWYVTNVRYPSGAVGCVSRNYSDHKWRIACESGAYPGSPTDRTFPNRDAAARAEREVALAQAQMPGEYQETPDRQYPHLVWPQCSCGWQAAGARRPALARIAHAEHARERHGQA